MNRRNFIGALTGAATLAFVSLSAFAQTKEPVTDLDLVTVHTNERLPVEYAPETTEVSEPILFGDGKRLVSIGPKK